ncbi:MAG: amidohydrolase family protein [Faecousia sp.]
MIIDFHTHTFPDAIAPKALKKLQGASHTRAFSDATVGGLQADMAARGIDYSVVLPVATNAAKVPHMNDSSAALNTGGSLIHFGAMHPDFDGWYAELGRMKELGLKGIKIHPVYQDVDIDDIRYLRILERCAELDLIVVAHSGDDIGFPGVVRCDPARSRNALRQVPGVKLVLAHMGGWKNWEQVAENLADTGCYLDTAFSLGQIDAMEASFYSEEERCLMSDEEFTALIKAFGADRVLFGTDSPWTNSQTEIRRILGLPGLNEAEKTAILGGNAGKLLNIGC